MHGRRRVKPTAEAERARKEKEAVKIKEYRQLRSNHEYTQDAFEITTKILWQNPDFYTIWNFRRNILIHGLLKDAPEDQRQESLSEELVFLQEIFQSNPKSYWIFNHRHWCLETMPNPDWKKELYLVEKMLELDARNFHGWDYRRYVKSKLVNSMQPKDLLQTDLDFTKKKLEQNFSNYSAWHQRSKLLPHLLSDANEDERKRLIDEEFGIAKSAIYTDPDDQSAWLYYWWLLGREPHRIPVPGDSIHEESSVALVTIKGDRSTIIADEIEEFKELLEEESNSKWCLQTLMHLYQELKYAKKLDDSEVCKFNDEIVGICDRLIKIDSMRARRYEDIRNNLK
ncbi:5280_t:CDS:2 [Paraglomus brasilianum]|uniref:Geranylgeranyl transferase type-2 subunit alpha n=1 Tax=Paraglomus brasilianum TaxID=144538 RepID=A0A9N8WFZ9_9GLOM|nr:5280_t:CDS:2 [Paraglomus brasilianum]